MQNSAFEQLHSGGIHSRRALCARNIVTQIARVPRPVTPPGGNERRVGLHGLDLKAISADPNAEHAESVTVLDLMDEHAHPQSRMYDHDVPLGVERLLLVIEGRFGNLSPLPVAVRRILPDDVKVQAVSIDRFERFPVRSTDIAIAYTEVKTSKEKTALVSMLKTKRAAAYVGLVSGNQQIEPERIAGQSKQPLRASASLATPPIAPTKPNPAVDVLVQSDIGCR